MLPRKQSGGEDLYRSESLTTLYGEYFDQCFIDFLGANFPEIDLMNWRKFEGLAAEFFARVGFRVDIGSGRNDGGIDLRFWPDPNKPGAPPTVIVQCTKEGGYMTRTGQQKLLISALALGAIFVTVVVGTPSAQAQTYTVVHRFMGGPTDGSAPIIGLIGDSAGNAYGTTVGGGASGAGVVFQQDKTKETVLYSFTGGTDGAYPNGITRDSAGNLYGTTAAGGSGCQGDGCGVVFRLEP